MATTATAASASVGGGGNVLSDKVSRALHVRTDTPAMRAALDALARLPDADGSPPGPGAAGAGRGGGGGAPAPTIDAKSVRAAIEGDALRRALAFQSELKRLAADASELRRRVGDVARVCDLVGRRVEGQIVEAEGGGAGAAPSDAHEAERSLASRLHSAQRSYVTSLRRQRAVESFLDRFDLDGNESRLLDHYNFEPFLPEGFCAGAAGEGDASDPWTRQGASLCALTEPRDGDDADAFLDALERLAVIRAELGRTFGGDGAGGAADGPEDGAGGRLGAHSALRMMEGLASRQERAEERLHAFVQNYLGVGDAAASAGAARPTSAPTSSADALSGRRHPSLPAEAPSAGLGRFRDGDEMDEAYGHPVLRRSLRVLRHSPARRDHALELLASGRRAEVTRRFLLALTSGYSGSPPLERMAHDPVAYVGDMLAFAFRSFRVEGELVRTLLSPASGEEDGEGAESDAVGDDGEGDGGGAPMSAAAMLGQSMSGLARPLRTRIMQVVSSLATRGGGQSDPAAAMRLGGGPDDDGNRDDDDGGGDSSLDRLAAIFSICGLLRFYGSAVTKALDKLGGGGGGDDGEENPLRSTCDACLSDAAESYAASLRAYGAVLSSSSPPSPGGESGADLASRAIVRVAEGRSASPGFAEDLPGGGDGNDAASRLLSLPFLVGTMLDAASACPPSGPDDAASLRSALQVAARCGLDPDDVGRYASAVDGMGESSLEALASSEARSVLSSTGLGGVASAYRDWSSDAAAGPMAGHPGLSRGELEAATRAFYSSLFSPPVPTFEGVISDPAMRKAARTRTARGVAGAYRELYRAATGDRGGYGPDLSFLGHDPDQVDTLLSL